MQRRRWYSSAQLKHKRCKIPNRHYQQNKAVEPSPLVIISFIKLTFELMNKPINAANKKRRYPMIKFHKSREYFEQYQINWVKSNDSTCHTEMIVNRK